MLRAGRAGRAGRAIHSSIFVKKPEKKPKKKETSSFQKLINNRKVIKKHFTQLHERKIQLFYLYIVFIEYMSGER